MLNKIESKSAVRELNLIKCKKFSVHYKSYVNNFLFYIMQRIKLIKIFTTTNYKFIFAFQGQRM